MHARYLVLNLLFLAPSVGLVVLRWRRFDKRHALQALLIMCVLTAVFDNVMITAGIVRYNPSEISGLMIGRAPIEDFSYTLAAVVLVTTLWGRGVKYEDTV